MKFAGFFRTLWLVPLAFVSFASVVVSAATLTPNIIVLLADDMGYGDPHCYNPDSKIPTPHMDRLAREGLRFTDAHTPASEYEGPLIEAGRETVASLLRRARYQTGRAASRRSTGWSTR